MRVDDKMVQLGRTCQVDMREPLVGKWTPRGEGGGAFFTGTRNQSMDGHRELTKKKCLLCGTCTKGRAAAKGGKFEAALSSQALTRARL